MPGKVKVKILAGRDLPIMDRASDTCDAFVEVKLGNTTHKTEVFRHSLNPQWNSEWFRFEVDDEELQDEPLQIRVMDYDTYTANDAIGKVYIDLNPLLSDKQGSIISGWFPIYDTMHGIRGEINVMAKVHLFSDSNRYRESSCGVQFFYSGCVPYRYEAQAILGFVEELVVNDDPEYQWIDKIRTPRASNEARQTLFSKLSGEVQRKIGLKALELGGNAVIGYHQCFDLEGESGIVVRGIGTAVLLVEREERLPEQPSPTKDASKESPVAEDSAMQGTTSATSPTGTTTSSKATQSPAKTLANTPRRSSDSDLSTPPKGVSGGSNTAEVTTNSTTSRTAMQRPTVPQERLRMLEYPFITMKEFPAGFIQHIGGVVSARSVKLLSQINNPDEPETRDAWWMELRKEIRSHVRALGCNVVLGYMEATNISDDVCILSASGTAAVLNSSSHDTHDIRSAPVLGLGLLPHPSVVTTLATNECRECDREKETTKDKGKALKIDIALANQHKASELNQWSGDAPPLLGCHVCHIPYSESSIPFPTNIKQCGVCRKAKVPDVLFMTIEPPPNIPIIGKGGLIQARVCKTKKDGKGEQNAREVSDSLPFLEYELHRQLLNKLKVKCMNAIFDLKVQVSVGDKLIVGIATGTAAYISALPSPNVPKIVCGKDADGNKITRIEKQLHDAIFRNKEFYSIKNDNVSEKAPIEKEESYDEDDQTEMDLSSGDKEVCILEVDDAEDVDIIAQMIDPSIPDGFQLCNTDQLPGASNFMCDLQMFTRIYRTKLPCSPNSQHVSKVFEDMINSLYVKLFMLIPCCLAGLSFQVDLVDQDELQISVIGVSVGLGDPDSQCNSMHNRNGNPAEPAQVNSSKQSHSVTKSGRNLKNIMHFGRRKYYYHVTLGEYVGIDITPLSYIPGRKIDKFLGDLDFFFIRESSSIRENGGLNGFIQCFVTEILAIVRAHVSALGGNAMVSFHMTQCILLYNPHKNQGQCLINVAGDAVSVQLPPTLQENENGK